MKNVPHWANLLPLLGGTLAYYFGLGCLNLIRRRAHRVECGQAPLAYWTGREAERDRPGPPSCDYCPEHDREYGPTTECPDCREEWSERLCERFDREEDRRSDGWYRDLANRASEPGFDPHDPWRDGQ